MRWPNIAAETTAKSSLGMTSVQRTVDGASFRALGLTLQNPRHILPCSIFSIRVFGRIFQPAQRRTINEVPVSSMALTCQAQPMVAFRHFHWKSSGLAAAPLCFRPRTQDTPLYENGP